MLFRSLKGAICIAKPDQVIRTDLDNELEGQDLPTLLGTISDLSPIIRRSLLLPRGDPYGPQRREEGPHQGGGHPVRPPAAAGAGAGQERAEEGVCGHHPAAGFVSWPMARLSESTANDLALQDRHRPHFGARVGYELVPPREQALETR